VVSVDKRVITSKDTRRKHCDALKHDLIERSLRPGASVAAIAQERGINANLLFNWRRLHLRERHASAAATATPTLLPVSVQASAALSLPKALQPRNPSGVIEIDIGAVRVRLRGAVDESSVRCVLQTLREFA
jgi:transposase